MKKDVILTGLRANNDLHIGNYFGALLPLVDMAKSRSSEYEINLFVPDLHSFTTPIDHSKLQAQIMHNLRLFVSAGLPLDNPKVHIYRQSYITAHSELTWILDCFTGFGQMARMTQFKEKLLINSDNQNNLKLKYKSQINLIIEEFNLARKSPETLEILLVTLQDLLYKATKYDELQFSTSSVGLFNYPVLMAADILLYGTKYVPVGDDQSQHLEFARDIAERMNSRFGELFVVPEPVKKQHEFFGNDQGLRIKDLVDPSKKMSKSDETGKGCIFLGDTPDAARKKVMSATTDSLASVKLDYENQPGVSNLLQILALLTGQSLQAVAEEHKGQERYGDFKAEVADAVANFLTDFQTNLANVDDVALISKLEFDEVAMNVVANDTLFRVQKAIGLR